MTSTAGVGPAPSQWRSATSARPRPLGGGAAQIAGVVVALSAIGVLGFVEARTPPNVTFGGVLVLVVLMSTWLFSWPASTVVTLAALSVPLSAYGVGADDVVAAQVEVLAILAVSVMVHLAKRAIDRYATLLAASNAQLLSVNTSLARFTADAAHEFRAPLAVVLSEVDLALARARSAEEYRGHLEAIGAEVARMRRTVAGLLTLARSDAGVLQAAFRRSDLVDLLEETLVRWRPLYERRGATLTAQLPEAGEIVCDPDLLVRVIDNLLENALRATPASGRTEVIATRDGACWRIAFTDSGAGIDARVVAPLLRGGSRVRSRGGDAGGTGLGLALCAAIVHVHSGSIGVESDGSGTRFVVTLPAWVD